MRRWPSGVGTTARASGAETLKVPRVSNSEVQVDPSSVEVADEMCVPEPSSVQTTAVSLPPKYMRSPPSSCRTIVSWVIGCLPPHSWNRIPASHDQVAPSRENADSIPSVPPFELSTKLQNKRYVPLVRRTTALQFEELWDEAGRAAVWLTVHDEV